MEYPGEGSDLRHFNKNLTQIDEEVIKRIIKMLFEGLVFIHEHRVCHRDIKPSNLYVTKDLSLLKILDFNVALRFSSGSKMIGVTGEEQFSAPELTAGMHYDERVDCWSAGIVMYQCFTKGKKIKFFAYDDEEDIQSLINKKL